MVDVLVAGWHPQLRRALAESDHGSRERHRLPHRGAVLANLIVVGFLSPALLSAAGRMERVILRWRFLRAVRRVRCGE